MVKAIKEPKLDQVEDSYFPYRPRGKAQIMKKRRIAN